MAASNDTSADADSISDLVDIDEQTRAAADDAETESAVSLGLDEVFEILKNKRRRTVLHYLENHEEPISLGEVAKYVAAEENDTSVEQVTSRERKCAYVGLYQCHLPKMDDMDIVDFNQNRGRIELGPNAPEVREYLETSDSTGRPWPLYYGSLGAMGAVVVGAVHVLAGPASLALGLSVAMLAAIAGLATFQLRSTTDADDDTED
jgi:hypothetical protein